MTRQLLDEAVGVAPQSTVDVDGIMRRETRKVMLRRTGVAMAAAVLAVVGVAASLQQAPGRSSPVTDPPPDATDVRFRLVADDPESARETAARLRQVIDVALSRAVPGARWITTGYYDNPAPDGQPPNLSGAQAGAGAEQMFRGGTGVVSGQRKGVLSVSIYDLSGPAPDACDGNDPKCAAERKLPRDSAERKRTMLLSCAGETNCTKQTGPGGEAMIVLTVSQKLKQFPGNLPAVVNTVRIGLADGRVLQVETSNEFSPAGSGSTTLQQADPPLTAAQVTAIATELAGRIKP